MNKRKIEKMLPRALETLRDPECGISHEKGKILKSYRSAISSFGAAVTMGSFRAAVSFFSADADAGKSKISRSKLLRAIEHVCSQDGKWLTPQDVCKKALADSADIKRMQEEFLHAAVALKLAMNAFELVDDDKKDNDRQQNNQQDQQ